MKRIVAVKVCAMMVIGLTGVSKLRAQLPPVPTGATLVTQGLYGPRGLKFGPNGDLYVALSGTGGTRSTGALCPKLQVAVNVGGPYTNGNTASIIKIDHSGTVTTVADGFPSALSQRPDVMGVADIAFLDGDLYAIVTGGGCSHGSLIPNMVAKVNELTGRWTMLANMSVAVAEHPVAMTPDDFEADGVFYNMITKEDKLYAVEANHGQIWSINRQGEVQMVTAISKAEGHVVPTSAVATLGGLLVGNLGLFPITPDSSVLLNLKGGLLEDIIDWLDPWAPDPLRVTSSTSPGVATVVAMDWGPDGLLYMLELSNAPGFPTPGFGKVVRIKETGVAEDVITGLSVPTGMTFGPDGALYVSNWGAAAAPVGQILRYNVH
jgi:hypothetical protein